MINGSDPAGFKGSELSAVIDGREPEDETN
jgi:hypothetical protein